MICARFAPGVVRHEAFHAFEQQQRKWRTNDTAKQGTTVYFLYGQRLCQPAFCAAVQLLKETINKIALEFVTDGVMQNRHA